MRIDRLTSIVVAFTLVPVSAAADSSQTRPIVELGSDGETGQSSSRPSIVPAYEPRPRPTSAVSLGSGSASSIAATIGAAASSSSAASSGSGSESMSPMAAGMLGGLIGSALGSATSGGQGGGGGGEENGGCQNGECFQPENSGQNAFSPKTVKRQSDNNQSDCPPSDTKTYYTGTKDPKTGVSWCANCKDYKTADAVKNGYSVVYVGNGVIGESGVMYSDPYGKNPTTNPPTKYNSTVPKKCEPTKPKQEAKPKSPPPSE